MKHLNLLSTNIALHGILIYRFIFIEGTLFWGTFFPMAFVGIVSVFLAIIMEVQKDNSISNDLQRKTLE